MKAGRYTHTAIVSHWLMALLNFKAFPLRFYMHELPISPTRRALK